MNDDSPRLMKRVWGRLVNKRMIPRYLFGLACVATVIGLFYAEEDWRGKRAWEKCKRELEAKGEVLDWNAYIPASVPDDQNIFKAPKMTEWFVKPAWPEATSSARSKSATAEGPFSLSVGWNTKRPPTLLAEVDLVLPGGPLPPEKVDALLRFDDPADRVEAARLIRESVGALIRDAWLGLVVARSLDQIHPLHLVLEADTAPTTNAVADLLSSGAASNQAELTENWTYLQVERFGSQGFHVSLSAWAYGAKEYLAASQPTVTNLDLLRKAVERSYARMDGDYERPFARSLPAFVRLRVVAQMQSRRAMCYLLLGQPESAWHELELIRDMCRMLEAKPGSNCPTVVAAMIDVAISGLYVSIIQDGLRLRLWREPELVAMQKQLTDINLLPLVRGSLDAQRAAQCRVFETYPRAELKELLPSGTYTAYLWQRLVDRTFMFVTFAPRGWFYQSMCSIAFLEQLTLGCFDIPSNQVLPRKADEIGNQMRAAFPHFMPYTYLAAMTVRDFERALRVLARNQTLVNEAYIACGLERYRLAHGQYPETLEALVPQFAAKLPHDIIGGQPLKYHRTADGQFVLYSVGWNEKDDGGVAGKAVEEGDWVWQ